MSLIQEHDELEIHMLDPDPSTQSCVLPILNSDHSYLKLFSDESGAPSSILPFLFSHKETDEATPTYFQLWEEKDTIGISAAPLNPVVYPVDPIHDGGLCTIKKITLTKQDRLIDSLMNISDLWSDGQTWERALGLSPLRMAQLRAAYNEAVLNGHLEQSRVLGMHLARKIVRVLEEDDELARNLQATHDRVLRPDELASDHLELGLTSQDVWVVVDERYVALDSEAASIYLTDATTYGSLVKRPDTEDKRSDGHGLDRELTLPDKIDDQEPKDHNVLIELPIPYRVFSVPSPTAHLTSSKSAKQQAKRRKQQQKRAIEANLMSVSFHDPTGPWLMTYPCPAPNTPCNPTPLRYPSCILIADAAVPAEACGDQTWHKENQERYVTWSFKGLRQARTGARAMEKAYGLARLRRGQCWAALEMSTSTYADDEDYVDDDGL